MLSIAIVASVSQAVQKVEEVHREHVSGQASQRPVVVLPYYFEGQV